MKKRGLFYVIFFLILVPNAFSIYEELIYSGTVEDRDVIDIAGSLFEFRIDYVSNKVLVEIDITGIILKSGECKIKGNFDICISNISFSYRNLTTYYEVYKTDVKVYQIKSKLVIKNSIEKNNILINEETTAELTLENTADLVASDVTATIDIPPSILVTNVEGCKKIADTIVFQDNVHPRQIRKCTYGIRGLSPDEFELTADVSYFDGVEQINTTSNTITPKVYNYSLKIKSKLNKTKFDIEEEFDLTINVENINDQHSLTITTLSINLPGRLLVIKTPPGTTINNNRIGWSGTLAPEESKDLVIKLKSLRTGNFPVLTEASYKISKFLRKAEESANIDIDCDCPYITHVFSQQIDVPEQNVRLKVFLVNPNKIHSFRNVDISYFSDIPHIQDYSTVYSEIKPLETIKIFDSSITGPGLDEVYHLNIQSDYESLGNQIFIVRDNIAIEVPKAEEEMPIDQEIIEETSEQNESEEEIEEQQEEQQKVSLEQEKTGQTIDETEKKAGPGENIQVTTLEGKESSLINSVTIIAFIAAIVFVLIGTIIFKRKKDDMVEEPSINEEQSKTGIIDKEKHNAGNFLSVVFRKGESAIVKTKHKGKKDRGFKDLERQVKELVNIFEKEKQLEKKGFLGKIFRRK